MVRRKYLIRSLGYAAAAAILIVSVWITAVSYVDKPDDYVAAQQEFFVPAGQRARIKLPDGTFVWLNAGSVLTYPSIFGEERKVYLKGEGFFDVAKNEKSPFIVSTGTLDIRALGTQFNVFISIAAAAAYPKLRIRYFLRTIRRCLFMNCCRLCWPASLSAP